MTGWSGQAMAGKRGLPKADIHGTWTAAYWNPGGNLLEPISTVVGPFGTSMEEWMLFSPLTFSFLFASYRLRGRSLFFLLSVRTSVYTVELMLLAFVASVSTIQIY